MLTQLLLAAAVSLPIIDEFVLRWPFFVVHLIRDIMMRGHLSDKAFLCSLKR